MAQLSQKDMNPSKIIGILFRVLSPDEIRKGSVAHCRIVNNGTELMTAWGSTVDHYTPSTSLNVFLI